MALSSTGGRVHAEQTEAMEAYRGIFIYGTPQKEATVFFFVQMELQSPWLLLRVEAAEGQRKDLL